MVSTATIKPFRRRPFVLVLFFLHVVALSTYTLLHYSGDSGQSGDYLSEADPFAPPLPPSRLPASLIEQTDRALMNEHYRKLGMRHSSQDANHSEPLVPCPLLPPNLVGRVTPDLFSYTMQQVEEHLANSSIAPGGHWSPPHCTAHHRVAILIPYRNREMQLRIFLNVMHPFLQKQQIDYRIYVIEPVESVKFNRALLFNIGFRESSKQYPWQCFVFHDVDLIPEDDRNIYSCPPEPRHMSVSVNTFGYELPYRGIFGGVSVMTTKQMEAVNGYSNQFFGWGAEDDDMSGRIITKFHISRYPASIGRYRMLRHRPDTPNSHRFSVLKVRSELSSVDGLSNLQYDIVAIEERKLFTHVRVTYNETLIKASVADIVDTKKQRKRAQQARASKQ